MKLKINLRNILSVKIHKIVLLLLALCIYNTAYGQNQRISVYGNNQSLQKVFEQIEQQTKLSVTYNQTKLDVNKKIKENFIDKKLSFVMDALLKNTGFTCNYEPEHIVITPSVQPKEKAAAKQTVQMKKIMGKVTGITGEPLIGANVLAIGSKQATITNLNGEFTLEVPADGKLQVTYIGYLPQEVSANGKTQLVIQLKEDSKLMDEVVVVGFGTQKKVNLTGAVTSVNIQETLGDRPITNVTAALQGVVPGLKIEGTTGTPGDNLSYNIRGTTSINGGGPLVLVNNVPMDINMIDPQDIESVSVLKDAASAAIYGARAAFGVILITTKQGKKDMAPKFNYNNNFSFSKALELPQKANPLESILAYKEMGWPNDTYVDGKNIPQWETYIRDYMDNPSKYPQGYVFDENGNLFLMRENDMFADMMENYGFMQNHSFSVSGGGSRTNYRIGLGYTNEDGILITDKDRYERANLSSFLSVEVNKWLTTQLDIRYANSTQNKVEQGGRNGVWGSAMQLPSYQNISPYEVDGITYPAETSATYIRYGEPRIVKKTDFRALGRIIISPLKNLKITGEYTYNRVTNYNRMYVNQYKYIGMNFTGILNNTENTRYALTQGFNNYNAINIFANYDFSIGNHNIGVMGGFNQEENHAESQWTERKDVLLSNLPSISGATGTTTATDTFNEYALRGLFYRVNYSYKDRYMVEANGRYDGTSRFPKNNRFGFFPSFSGGWRISEESFMAGTRSVLSNLKFRASWDGWELELNWRDRIKDFSYRIGFNLYDSQSEITKFNNETNLLGTYRKGQKIGEIWGYVTDRFYREDDFNADGTLKEGIPIPKGAGKVYPGDVLYKNFDDDATTIWSGKGTADDPGDQRIIGNSTPRFHYGINAGLSWKGFDLSIFLRGVGKRDFWRTDQIAWPTATWGSLFKETLNFWTPEHTDAYFPRVYANNGVNTATNRWKQTKYLANAAYVKLQNITLSYTLPKVWTKQIYFDEVKVFFSGENLHTWDHLPEGLESDMLSKGAWEYPFMKKFSLGFNVTF